jgi:hypothetical protein
VIAAPQSALAQKVRQPVRAGVELAIGDDSTRLGHDHCGVIGP